MSNLGFTDASLEGVTGDKLGMESYIEGLKSFIEKCDTPMTIAIQGAWGSGKTSIMHMVEKELSKNIRTFWFNTWKFSQFNMNENLSLSFLACLAGQIKREQEELVGKKWLGHEPRKRVEAFFRTVSAVIDLTLGGGGSAATDYLKYILNEEKDPLQVVDNLKKTFQEAIDSLPGSENENFRAVFFIDDLDRIQPVRAVEFLEMLKLFLDCDKCVFVLAIDEEVISQGVKDKYPNMKDEKKEKEFFEKFIQVPFVVPEAHYQMKEYIKDMLQEDGEKAEEGYQEYYLRLLKTSVGCNPRAVKRIFNAHYLHMEIYKKIEKKTVDSYGKLLWFGCLCLQTSYKSIYNYFVTQSLLDSGKEGKASKGKEGVFQLNKEFFQKVVDDGLTEETCQKELYKLIPKEHSYENERLRYFLEVFYEILVEDRDGNSINRLLDALRQSLTVSEEKEMEGNSIQGKGARHAKTFEKEFQFRTPLSMKNGDIKSYNGMKVESYTINKTSYLSPGEKFSTAELLKNAMEYAGKQKPEEFQELAKKARNASKEDEIYTLHRLFSPGEDDPKKELSVPSGIGENPIFICTYSSNDEKMRQICKVYEELGLDAGVIEIQMKEARED